MRTGGVLYDSRLPNTSGEILLPKQYKSIPSFRAFFFGIGIGCIAFSMFGIGLSLLPIVSLEILYRMHMLHPGHTPLEDETILHARAGFKTRAAARTLARELDLPNSSFSLYIPSIDVKAPIIPEVDPTNKTEYLSAFATGIAHAKGSPLPGNGGGTYLFAHSTNGLWNVGKYNAVFYLLKELTPEENNMIYLFYNDTVYPYAVVEKRVVDAQDTSWLLDVHRGPERLILQSCWPPGTVWKRLVVVAERAFET